MDAKDWARGSGWLSGTLKLLDVLLASVLALALLPARLLREIGLHRLPRSRRMCDRLGVLPVHDHYYEPLVSPDAHLSRPLDAVRPLPGVSLRLDAQLDLLQQLSVNADEAKRLAEPGASDTDPTAVNPFYGPGDADVLYLMVRHLRPRRVLEIGSGHSTKIVAAALATNVAGGAPPASHVCVEPYENPWLEKLPVHVLRERIEDVDADVVTELEDGDILFIDASHVIRPQGDVLRVFLDLLPQLRSGVLVHVHDVFTPRDYPDEWVRERRRLWNEQYLLEGVLSGGSRYEVVLALNHLANEAPDELAAVCPAFRRNPTAQPGAFWIRVVE